MIRSLPALGGPECIIFCLALASVLLHKRMGRELGEAGAEVWLSQSERPWPKTDAPAKSMGNCTSGKERATFKHPSDTGSVRMWPLPCLCCQMQRDGGSCPGRGLSVASRKTQELSPLQHCSPHSEQRPEELLPGLL